MAAALGAFTGRAVTATWVPWRAQRVDGVPAPGSLVAVGHVVWHVAAVRRLLRRADAADADWPGARTHEVLLDARTGVPVDWRVETNRYSAWWTYRDGYPLCSCCQEPQPCRSRVAYDMATRGVARMRRFEVAGICPACAAAVTPAEASVSFPDNTVVPLGPPVSFHLGPARCRAAAIAYERDALAQGGAPRLAPASSQLSWS
jgi:hypothetical protein